MSQNKSITRRISIFLNGEQVEGTMKDLTVQSRRLRREINGLTPGTKEFVQKSRELRKVNSRLKSLRAEVNKTGNAFTRMTKALGPLGRTLVGAFAVQNVIQALVSMVKTFVDFQKANSKLAAVLGTTRKNIKALENDAKRLGAATKFTATEVTKLQTEFAKLGFKEHEILAATEATLNLAAAAETDLARAAEVAGSTVRSMGLHASETGRVTDVMAKSFSTSALDIERFAETIKYAGPIAKTMGVDIETTAAVMAKLADAGIHGSMAGTSLKKIFTELGTESSKLSDLLGFTVKNGDDLTRAFQVLSQKNIGLAEAQELVGDRAQAALLILKDQPEAIANLAKAYDGAKGAAKAMADEQMDNLAGSFTLLQSAWDGFILGVESGDGPLSNALRGIVDLGASVLGLLTPLEKQSDLMREQQIEMNVLVSRITDTNIKEGERAILINDLNQKYPKLLENMDKETVSNAELTNRLREVNEQMVNRIIIQKEQEKITEIAEKQAALKREGYRREGELLEALAEISTRRNLDLLKEGTTTEKVRFAQEQLRKQFNQAGIVLDGAKRDSKSLSTAYSLMTQVIRESERTEIDLNAAMDEKAELMDRLGIKLGENVDLQEKGNKAVENAVAAVGAEVNSLAKLRGELKALKDEREVVERGGARFIELTGEIAQKEDELTLTEGRLTEAMREAKKVADERMANLEKLRKTIADLQEQEARRDLSDEDAQLVAMDQRYAKLLDSAGGFEAEYTELLRLYENERIALLGDLAEQRNEKLLEEAEKRYAAESEIERALMDERQRASLDVDQHYEDLYALADEYGLSTVELQRMHGEAKLALLEEQQQQEIDSEQQTQEEIAARRSKFIVQMAGMALEVTDTLSNLQSARQSKREQDLERRRKKELESLEDNEVAKQKAEERFAKESEKLQKEEAKKRKAIAIAEAIINTASAVAQINAHPASNLDITQTLRFAMMALVTAQGVAQVRQIQAQQFAAGGYYNVKGDQTRKNYKAQARPDMYGGFVSSPSLVLGGEEGPEYWINAEKLKVPWVADVAGMIENMDVQSVRQFAGGGFDGGTPAATSTTAVPVFDNSEMRETMERNTAILAQLSATLQKGIPAYYNDAQAEKIGELLDDQSLTKKRSIV